MEAGKAQVLIYVCKQQLSVPLQKDLLKKKGYIISCAKSHTTRGFKFHWLKRNHQTYAQPLLPDKLSVAIFKHPLCSKRYTLTDQ